MDILKIYGYVLQREHEGMSFFRQNAKRFSHAAAANVFEKLADEEGKHIEFIQGMISALKDKAASSIGQGLKLEAEGFFSQRANTELLDQSIVEAMVPDLAVLRTAYLIERDFAEFYQMAADRVDDDASKAALGMLARWERGHEQLFKELHDKAFEQYAGMPWGG